LVLCLTSGTTDADLVSRWEFDESNGNIAYDSANGNHGTIYGATWTSGIINGALNFDGLDDYVNVGDNPSLDFGDADSFSICAWIKYSGTMDGERHSIVGKRNHDGNAWQEGYGLWVTFNNLYFHIEDTSNTYVGIFGSTLAADNKWHHVAAVRNTTEDKLYLYIDGSFDATPVEDTTTNTLSGNEPLTIGRSHGDNYFTGIIDDVRIYNHALSENEIRELIPEPATVLLLGLGGLTLRIKRKT